MKRIIENVLRKASLTVSTWNTGDIFIFQLLKIWNTKGKKEITTIGKTELLITIK